MGPMAALAWLVAVGTRNQVRRRIARLKNPRYAAAMVVGLLYFWWIFVPHGRRAEAPGISLSPAFAALVPFGLVVLVLSWWVLGGYERALAFTPAEVHFLFPAPLTRASLIRFKLLRAQPALAMTTVLMAILLRGSLPWYLRMASVWVLVTTLQWHQITASLVRAGATGHGAVGLRRLGVPLAVVVLAVVALGWSIVTAPTAGGAGPAPDLVGRLVAGLTQPVPWVALFPFRLVLAPVLASDAHAWLLALPGALLVLALHYVWLLRTDTAFEEVAAEAGRIRAQRLAAFKAGRLLHARPAVRAGRRPRIPLASLGPPATAVLWKNVLALLGDFRLRILGLVVGAILAVGGVTAVASGSLNDGVQTVLGACVGVAAMATVFAPRIVSTDWRRDLAKVELLKTYPLGGFWLAAAEIGAPVLGISVFQLALLVPAAVLLPFGTGRAAPHGLLLAGAMAALALPAVNGMLVAIHNAFALLFPAWSNIGTERPGGIEHMGQTILTVAGTLALFTVAAVPPTVLGAAVWLVLRPLRVVAIVAGGGVAIVALGAELALAVFALGWLYDRLDPAAAGLVK